MAAVVLSVVGSARATWQESHVRAETERQVRAAGIRLADVDRAVDAVILTAMSLLAFLGLRYPVRLLPILLFEALWKLVWLGVVALPAVAAGNVDEAMRQVIVNCLVVVIVFAVVPWRYVWQRYVAAKGDRWRGVAA